MKHHKLIKEIRSLLCVVGLLGWSIGNCTTHTLIVSEGKRLEASIAPDVMNRITVVNDRITSIFGDEGTFVTQTEDQTGQVFIKPTIENGSKPISLTIITENGITQDFALNPIDSAASTILLKNTNPSQTNNSGANYESLFFNNSNINNPTISDQVTEAMKQAVSGKLPLYNKSVSNRKSVSGYKTSFIKAYQSGSFLITVWTAKNTNKNNEFHERLFYQPGDLAISFQDQYLKGSKTTILYVVSRL